MELRELVSQPIEEPEEAEAEADLEDGLALNYVLE